MFRTDASTRIGAGHAMRCLTLAQMLRARGADCTFLMRELPGHLAHTVAAAGFAVTLLRPPAPKDEPDCDLAHADWLGLSQAEDAGESRAAIREGAPDWLVVDHYALDARWERTVCLPGTRILAIDDLADRAHHADLLLDQNLGRRAADYDGLAPEGCIRLIGPRFALLRSEFAAERPAAVARRLAKPPGTLLVTMGGVDAHNATGQVLDALAALTPPLPARVTVVLGAQAPHLVDVQARVATLPFPASVEVGVRDMAGLMAAADLAIGAAGGTSWERCCLGLPTLLLTVAANQHSGADALDRAGAAILMGDLLDGTWPGRLQAEVLRLLATPERLARLSRAAAALVDGGGAGRVGAMMASGRLTVRRATPADGEAVWRWRHAGGAERFYRSGRVTSLADHLQWFSMALDDPERMMLVVEQDGEPAGHVRLDRSATDRSSAVIGICLAEQLRGRGLALPVMEASQAHARGCGVTRIEAEVHQANAASLRLFDAAGYQRISQAGDFVQYVLPLDSSISQSQRS